MVLATLMMAAVILLVFKHWRDKFPYSGTWAKAGGSPAGSIQKIHFSPWGACTVDVFGQAGQLMAGVPCEYTMVAGKATIEYVVHRPGVNDRTEEERVWFKGQLTPDANGQTLSLSRLDGAKFNVKEGNITGRQTNQMGKRGVLFQKQS